MSVYKLQGSHKPTADSSSFVGEVGDLFYNDTGTIRISDGQTPGGVRPDSIIESLLQLGITDGNAGQVLQTDGTGNFSFTNQSGGGGGGSSSLFIKEVNASNTVTSSVSNVTDIRFDTAAGFDVTDLGSGAVKVGMNSTFKTIKVNNQNDLVAIGLDTLELVAGSGISITTNPSGSPHKTLTITNTGSGGGGGGGSITVQDEGSQLTTAASTINFTGGGITASHDSSTSVTTVNVDNNNLIGVLIDASINTDGELILTHVSTFNSNNALINSDGEFILQD